MGKRGSKFNSDLLRARVRQMLAAGFSEARIVKETGKSATHIARIAGQERSEMEFGAGDVSALAPSGLEKADG